jgi:hypothetical protein
LLLEVNNNVWTEYGLPHFKNTSCFIGLCVSSRRLTPQE